MKILIITEKSFFSEELIQIDLEDILETKKGKNNINLFIIVNNKSPPNQRKDRKHYQNSRDIILNYYLWVAGILNNNDNISSCLQKFNQSVGLEKTNYKKLEEKG